jgi:hypothetical protein
MPTNRADKTAQEAKPVKRSQGSADLTVKARVIDLGRKQTVREQERNILRRLVAALEKGVSTGVSIHFPVYLEQLNGAFQRASYFCQRRCKNPHNAD